MDNFKKLISLVTPEFKKFGFEKKSNDFYVTSNNNFGIINFQKSRENLNNNFKFTINFGIYSNILGQLDYDYNNSKKPEIEQCHWLSRIGAFIENGNDIWWDVKSTDDINMVSLNVIKLIQSVILIEINKRLTDDGLISCWINEKMTGTTELNRFKYLTILLKEKDENLTLNQVIDDFFLNCESKQSLYLAKEHLNDIGIVYLK
jgi:hypothetical protein